MRNSQRSSAAFITSQGVRSPSARHAGRGCCNVAGSATFGQTRTHSNAEGLRPHSGRLRSEIVSVLWRLALVISNPLIADIGDMNSRPPRPQTRKEGTGCCCGLPHVSVTIQPRGAPDVTGCTLVKCHGPDPPLQVSAMHKDSLTSNYCDCPYGLRHSSVSVTPRTQSMATPRLHAGGREPPKPRSPASPQIPRIPGHVRGYGRFGPH